MHTRVRVGFFSDRALFFLQAVLRVLVPVRSALARKQSLSNITDFMTGSSRRERIYARKAGCVDCVLPLSKCVTALFDLKWIYEIP